MKKIFVLSFVVLTYITIKQTDEYAPIDKTSVHSVAPIEQVIPESKHVTKHYYHQEQTSEPKWIRPAGNEYNLRTPNGKGSEQLWRMNEALKYNQAHQAPMDEDRVREIVREEKDY